MLSMTRDEWMEIRNRFPDAMDGDDALDYVCALLQAEIDYTKLRDPECKLYVHRVERELRHLKEVASDVSAENFEEEL